MTQFSGLPFKVTRPRNLAAQLRRKRAETSTTSQADFSTTSPRHLLISQKATNGLPGHESQAIGQEPELPDMVEELNAARSLLSSALDKYLGACLAIQKCHLEKASFVDVPPELSPHVESEEHIVTALENKLRRAKAAIRWSRNCSPSLVPIHRLPADLLASIFLLVVNFQAASDWSGRPEVLTHVCSRWRETALEFPLLWRYISLPFTGSAGLPQVNRAVLFASRARQSRLYVRLDPNDSAPTIDDQEYPRVLVDAIAPHIHTLEVTSETSDDPMDRFEYSFLAAYFAQRKPKVLKALTLSLVSNPILIDVTTRVPGYARENCKILDTENLYATLAPVTVLRIRGVYPFWTSRAYHGLVELRLSPRGRAYYGGILSSSPALRTLEYSIAIVEVLSLRSSGAPVPLDYLESLNVKDMPPAQLGLLLRVLAPGPKPLQLAVHNSDNALLYLLQSEGGKSFFARSNVTSIYAKSLGYTCFSLLSDLCPNLKTLALDGLGVVLTDSWPMSELKTQIDLFTPPARVEKLAISNGFVDNDALLKLIDKLPAL